MQLEADGGGYVALSMVLANKAGSGVWGGKGGKYVTQTLSPVGVVGNGKRGGREGSMDWKTTTACSSIRLSAYLGQHGHQASV